MTSLNSDYLNLNQPSSPVELYQLDLTNAGGSMVYLTPQQTASGTVIHNGLTYTSIPIAMSRAKTGTTGTLPQPQLSVGVTENPLLRAAIAAYGDLAGCKVKKFHTFAKYLDAANTTRINSLNYSQDLAIGVGANGTTVTSNATTAPDGTLTADLLLDTTSNVQHYLTRATTVTANIGDPINYSVYLKDAGIRYVLMYIATNGASGFGGGPVIDLQTGTIVAYNNQSALTNLAVTPVGNGWYRVSATTTVPAASYICCLYCTPSASPNAPSYVGTGTGVYVWGMQAQRPGYAQVDASLMGVGGATITLNTAGTVDPLGTVTADIIADTVATSTHYAYQFIAGFLAGQEVTFTTTLKPGATITQVMIRFLSSTALPTTAYCYANLTNGTLSNAVGLTRMTSTALNNGYYRYSITITTTAAGSLTPTVMLVSGGNNTYLGTGAGIYIWNSHLTWDTALKNYQYTTTTHAPFADATATSAVESYVISQMVDFNPDTVTWKLTTPIDRPNLILPRLQYLKDNVGNQVYAPGLNRVME